MFSFSLQMEPKDRKVFYLVLRSLLEPYSIYSLVSSKTIIYTERKYKGFHTIISRVRGSKPQCCLEHVIKQPPIRPIINKKDRLLSFIHDKNIFSSYTRKQQFLCAPKGWWNKVFFFFFLFKHSSTSTYTMYKKTYSNLFFFKLAAQIQIMLFNSITTMSIYITLDRWHWENK